MAVSTAMFTMFDWFCKVSSGSGKFFGGVPARMVAHSIFHWIFFSAHGRAWKVCVFRPVTKSSRPRFGARVNMCVRMREDMCMCVCAYVYVFECVYVCMCMCTCARVDVHV